MRRRPREGGRRLQPGTASPFNIKVESHTLRDFTRDEVAELYGQHTAETGQTFDPAVIDRVFDLTQGQPWLVNGTTLYRGVNTMGLFQILPEEYR